MATKLRLTAGGKHKVSVPMLSGGPGAPDIPPSPSRFRLTIDQPSVCSQSEQAAPLVIVRVSSDINELFRREMKNPGTIILEFSAQFIEQRAKKGIDVDIAAGPCGFQGEFDLESLT